MRHVTCTLAALTMLALSTAPAGIAQAPTAQTGQAVPAASATAKRHQHPQSGQGEDHDQHGTTRCLAHRVSSPPSAVG